MAGDISLVPISPIGIVALDPRITVDFQTRSTIGTSDISRTDYMNLIVTITNLKCNDFYSILENLKANIASNITTTTD